MEGRLESRRQIYEEIRERLASVRLYQVAEANFAARMVATRNSGPRPCMADAVRLNDVWKALEDVLLASRTDAPTGSQTRHDVPDSPLQSREGRRWT